MEPLHGRQRNGGCSSFSLGTWWGIGSCSSMRRRSWDTLHPNGPLFHEHFQPFSQITIVLCIASVFHVNILWVRAILGLSTLCVLAMEFKQVRSTAFPSLCASWALRIGDRAALAGPSNSGKSLQLEILSGEVPILSGAVSFDPDIRRLAILRSGWIIPRNMCGSVKEELSSLNPPVRRGQVLSPEAARPSSLLVDTVDVQAHLTDTKEALLAKLETCMVDFELDGDASLHDLPQGILLRIAAAKVTLQQPDALLLDDATEGLDDDSCNWLEDFLAFATFKIVLVASHDRTLMDKICNQVIVIQDHETRVLPGNYTSSYLAGGEFLHFDSFSLWQPKSSGLRATQAACGFASLVAEDLWQGFEDFGERSGAATVVDVGTGTGILSLIVAQQWQRLTVEAGNPKPDLQLWAIELDEPAVRIATANFSSSPWQDRLHTVHSSFDDWMPQWPEKQPPLVFICNPPYDDDVVNTRAGGEEAMLSRRRALERSFLPLEDLFHGVKRRFSCEMLWILWGNAEASWLQKHPIAFIGFYWPIDRLNNKDH